MYDCSLSKVNVFDLLESQQLLQGISNGICMLHSRQIITSPIKNNSECNCDLKLY